MGLPAAIRDIRDVEFSLLNWDPIVLTTWDGLEIQQKSSKFFIAVRKEP